MNKALAKTFYPMITLLLLSVAAIGLAWYFRMLEFSNGQVNISFSANPFGFRSGSSGLVIETHYYLFYMSIPTFFCILLVLLTLISIFVALVNRQESE